MTHEFQRGRPMDLSGCDSTEGAFDNVDFGPWAEGYAKEVDRQVLRDLLCMLDPVYIPDDEAYDGPVPVTAFMKEVS